MKTTKLIFALSFALVLAAGFNFTYAANHLTQGLPVINKPSTVIYDVRIENAAYFKSTDARYLVMMTDETGRPIAPPQAFQAGIWDYTFSEGGTVRGTRIAKLVKLPLGSNSFGIPQTAHTGSFIGGACYLFVIHPISTETIPAKEIR